MNSAGNRILITGGSGLIGTRLTALLLASGYDVAHLVRKRAKDASIENYLWDPLKKQIDTAAFINTDHVIHLAGENIAARRWTNAYKKIIVESRTLSAALLREKINAFPNVQSVICASGIGIYKDQQDHWINETSEQSTSFPADTCRQWESANGHYPCRTVILRTGIVLSQKGGALPELIQTKSFGVLPYFGNGWFYQSWIHIDDLCRMYIYAIENPNVQGIYNAVAPEPVTNMELIKAIRHALNKFLIIFPVPKILLRMILGEKAIIVTEGSRVSAEKIRKEGFQFRFNDINHALTDIFQK